MRWRILAGALQGTMGREDIDSVARASCASGVEAYLAARQDQCAG
jgi:hypothetical protein